MASGLVRQIDAKVTVRGRKKRFAFPHKLFMDYLAAWHLSSSQNFQEIAKQIFPTWADIKNHEEIVKACCGLMKAGEIRQHIINVLKSEQKILYDNFSFVLAYDTMSCIQKECGIQIPDLELYPSCGRSLSEVLNTAKLAVITKLTDGECDDNALPCNADIAINLAYGLDAKTLSKSGNFRLLQKNRDHIIGINMKFYTGPEGMERICSLLASSSLRHLSLTNCYLPKAVVLGLSHMPRLTFLELCASNRIGKDSLTSYGDLWVAAIKAWNGQSKLQVLKLCGNVLSTPVCNPLLIAIAANCPDLKHLDMRFNNLNGCLAGFLENPPPALSELYLDSTWLKTEDLEHLTAAFTAGKLQCLELLAIVSSCKASPYRQTHRFEIITSPTRNVKALSGWKGNVIIHSVEHALHCKCMLDHLRM